MIWQPGSKGAETLYRDGIIEASVIGQNISGTLDMSNPVVEAGGLQTKVNWTSNGSRPPTGTCSSAIGIGSQAGGWLGNYGTVNSGDCSPAPPIVNEFVDDVILMKQ
jgi:hypothetical protein